MHCRHLKNQYCFIYTFQLMLFIEALGFLGNVCLTLGNACHLYKAIFTYKYFYKPGQWNINPGTWTVQCFQRPKHAHLSKVHSVWIQTEKKIQENYFIPSLMMYYWPEYLALYHRTYLSTLIHVINHNKNFNTQLCLFLPWTDFL